MPTKQGEFRTPQIMMKELDISAATLRRWSEEFADYLSAEATPTQGRRHRRYSAEDLAVLTIVKALMNDGLTYEQVRQQLVNREEVWVDRVSRIPDDDEFEDDLADTEEMAERGIMTANGSDSTARDFITNTLTTLSDNQKSVLNSQAANRELLGVLIQDNFNLKEENTRLRERVQSVERNLAQIRQEEEWRRESMRHEVDAKLMQVQQMAAEALTVANTPQELPELKAVNDNPGCLGALLGAGDIKIVASPRRRRKNQAAPTGPVASFGPPAAGPPPPAYPKPTAPPE